MSERIEQIQEELEYLHLELKKIQVETEKKQVVLEGEAQTLKLQAAILETKKHILSLEQDISEMDISSLTAHNKGCLNLIDADLEKKCDETILHVTAEAPTLGWCNVALSSVVYVMPPADGIQDFILHGQAPSGLAATAIETFQVSASVPSADWLQGVRIINSCGTSLLTLKMPVREQAPIGDDSFGIEAAVLKGDKLIIDVRYGGGCRQHTFQLNWNGKFLKSIPMQVPLELSHNANGDTCKAIIRERLQFDLSVIIEEPSQYVLRLGSMIAHVPNKNKVIVDDMTLPPL